MASKLQQRANRRNSQLSTGPRTADGKNRTRLNGLRHGLTGQFTLMPHEDRQAFKNFCAGLLKDLAPVGDLEQTLAQTIAQDHWRLNRASAIEENLFALGLATSPVEIEGADQRALTALTQAQTFLNDASKIALLSLYAQRIQRGIEKNTVQLRQLQSVRKAAQQQALEEAILLAELNESQGLPVDDAAIGSGFSAFEFTRIFHRHSRLKQARSLQPQRSRTRAA